MNLKNHDLDLAVSGIAAAIGKLLAFASSIACSMGVREPVLSLPSWLTLLRQRLVCI